MTDNYTNQKTLYLDGPGRRLSIDNHTYIATIDRSEPIASIPAEQLESVICVGPVSISAGARERLLRDQVNTIFLSTTHRYLGGQFSSSLHDSTRLVAQVNSTADAMKSHQSSSNSPKSRTTSRGLKIVVS
jgi:CRISPR/Cas system-associated endonuclease Cas1